MVDVHASAKLKVNMKVNMKVKLKVKVKVKVSDVAVRFTKAFAPHHVSRLVVRSG